MSQLELFDKSIRIRIISDKGHQSFHLALCDANKFLIEQSKKLGLWLYIDGIHLDPNKIDVDTLSLSKEIILARALVRG
jgi:hypothetical protein